MANRTRLSRSGKKLLSPVDDDVTEMVPPATFGRRSTTSLESQPQRRQQQQQWHASAGNASLVASRTFETGVSPRRFRHQSRRNSTNTFRSYSERKHHENHGSRMKNLYPATVRRSLPGIDTYSDEGSIASAPISSMQHFANGRSRSKTRSVQSRDESPISSRHSASFERMGKPSSSAIDEKLNSQALDDIKQVIDGKHNKNFISPSPFFKFDI